jgi:predicted transcriptional regulator
MGDILMAVNENEVGADILVALTTDIVSAYLGRNSVSVQDLPDLIKSVHSALGTVSVDTQERAVEEAKSPAVSVRKSVTDDFLICLEDGLKFKSLKRHLRAKYNMSPDDYRAKWGLPSDYPMVAPNYAKRRSELAKRMGLGQGASR